jgi:hypothetical protein
MNDLLEGDLKVITNPSRRDAIELSWLGRSGDRYPGKLLTPYFQAALAEATERAVPIELHFQKLEHFNSSTITVIIQFIQEARNRGVHLIMVYDQALKWQKLSFDALRVFAKDDLFQLRCSP